MAAETGFMIDGSLYEVPAFDTFTMDEAQVLYDYCGLTLEDFVPAEDQTDEENEQLHAKMRNPGFIRALMHISYQRGNPRLSHGKVKQLIGGASLISSLERLGEEQEDDAVPPASTTEPNEPSQTSSVGSSESSGDDSRRSSDGQVVQLAATTTSG